MNRGPRATLGRMMTVRPLCFLLILLCLPSIARPKDKPEYLVEKHENGKLKLKVPVVGGKYHGSLKRFDEKGKVLEMSSYHHGRLDGKRRLYEDGKPISEELWSMGELLQPVTKAFLSRRISEIRRLRGPKEFDAARIKALRELQVYRFICHMPWEKIRLTKEANMYADHGAEICEAIGRLSHHPKNPGWDKDKYAKGSQGARMSNLGMSSTWNTNYTEQIPMYIDDGNTPSLGHRRHCLNPVLGEVGMGAKGKFAAMYWGGANDPEPDWHLQSLPSRGLTPTSLFDPSWDWHVAWNPKHYRCPDDKALTVEVLPLSGRVTRGTHWSESLKRGRPLAFHPSRVDRSGVGPPCVIFRPKGKPSVKQCLIVIKGLVDSQGQPAKVEILAELTG